MKWGRDFLTAVLLAALFLGAFYASYRYFSVVPPRSAAAPPDASRTVPSRAEDAGRSLRTGAAPGIPPAVVPSQLPSPAPPPSAVPSRFPSPAAPPAAQPPSPDVADGSPGSAPGSAVRPSEPEPGGADAPEEDRGGDIRRGRLRSGFEHPPIRPRGAQRRNIRDPEEPNED